MNVQAFRLDISSGEIKRYGIVPLGIVESMAGCTNLARYHDGLTKDIDKMAKWYFWAVDADGQIMYHDDLA